jgi:hypothetical protein
MGAEPCSALTDAPSCVRLLVRASWLWLIAIAITAIVIVIVITIVTVIVTVASASSPPQHAGRADHTTPMVRVLFDRADVVGSSEQPEALATAGVPPPATLQAAATTVQARA